MGGLTLLLLLFGGPAECGPLGYNPGRWLFKTSLDWFATDSNYTDSGGAQSLSGDNRFDVYNLNLHSRYDLNDRVSVFGGLGGAAARAASSSATVTRFTPTDLALGIDYGFRLGFLQIIPEIAASYPMNPTSPSQTVPMTGEGVWTAQAGTYASLEFSQLLAYAYAGYMLRGEGRSTLLPWLVHSTFRVGPILASAEVGGFYTIGDDRDASNPTARRATSFVANAGSWRFYSTNPNLIEMRVLGGFQATPELLIQGGYGRTLLGQRTAQGQSFIVQVTFGFDTDPIRGAGRPSSWGEEVRREHRYSPDDATELEFRPDVVQEPGVNPSDLKGTEPEADSKESAFEKANRKKRGRSRGR